LVGKIVDKLNIKVTLPIVFILRALNFYIVYKIKDPELRPALYFTAVPMLHFTFFAVVLTLTSYLQKQYPKDIRAICMMVEGLVAVGALVVYDHLRLWMVQLGFNMPFVGITVMDLFVAVASILLFVNGYMGPPKTKLTYKLNEPLAQSLYLDTEEETRSRSCSKKSSRSNQSYEHIKIAHTRSEKQENASFFEGVHDEQN
jgi:hypothetical protein